MNIKRKVIIGTLASALVFGGAFVVGAANDDDSSSLNRTNKIENEKINNTQDDRYDDMYDDDVIDDDDSNLKQDDSSKVNANSKQLDDVISQVEALNIAKKSVVNGILHEIKLEHDDGLLKYEVELQTDRGEAEVDIEARTGKVLEVEYDD